MKSHTRSLAMKFVPLTHPARWLHCTLLSGHWRGFNGTEEDRLRDLNTCQQETVCATDRSLLSPSIPSSPACCSDSWSLWWHYGISSGTLHINTGSDVKRKKQNPKLKMYAKASCILENLCKWDSCSLFRQQQIIKLIEASMKHIYLNLKLLLLGNWFITLFPFPKGGLLVTLHCILRATVLIQAQTLINTPAASFPISTAVSW